mmetsp:Transcript_84743/g.243247  ORF Transcript_84743/g.243247 Transcript_84743/m.243247 type:complete len:210 (+) Transcript_84743:459-1088(+)
MGKPKASRICPPLRMLLPFLYGIRSSSNLSSSRAHCMVSRFRAMTSHGDVATISIWPGGQSRPRKRCTPMAAPTPMVRVGMPSTEMRTSPRKMKSTWSSSTAWPAPKMMEPALKYLGELSFSSLLITASGTESKTLSLPNLGTDSSALQVSLSKTASRACGCATMAFSKAWRYNTMTMTCVMATTSWARSASMPKMLFWKHQSPLLSST